MKPDKIKKISKAQLLISSEEYWAEKKSTIVGLLKDHFLFDRSAEYIQIADSDWSDYRGAVDDFKQINGLPRGTFLEDWEDKTAANKQCEAFNKFAEKYNGRTNSRKKKKGATEEEST